MNSFEKITEQPSKYNNLEKMEVAQILHLINNEDKLVPLAVEKVLPQIEALATAITHKLAAGGRLFYIGTGTSGRMGVIDASENPPTFGVSPQMVTGIMAGGKEAMFSAVENAEDDPLQGWTDLQMQEVSTKDIVVGISASGTTPYVLGALQKSSQASIVTGSICCNPHSPISSIAKHAVEIIVGPEFITGSTRMKCGTAQKLVLNMLSTSVMIKLGRVQDNKMVNMTLNNAKLMNRGIAILMGLTGEKNYDVAKNKLLQYGNVKEAAKDMIAEMEKTTPR